MLGEKVAAMEGFDRGVKVLLRQAFRIVCEGRWLAKDQKRETLSQRTEPHSTFLNVVRTHVLDSDAQNRIVEPAASASASSPPPADIPYASHAWLTNLPLLSPHPKNSSHSATKLGPCTAACCHPTLSSE